MKANLQPSNPLRPVSLAAVLAMLVLLLSACAHPHAEPGSPVPGRLTLEFRSDTTDHRLMLFILDQHALLSFAGGRDAFNGQTAPVGTLTHEQLQATWDIITRYRLLEARNAPLFTKAEKVTYDLTLATSQGERTLRTVDDRVPGLAELQALLFKYQADIRYPKLPGVPGIK